MNHLKDTLSLFWLECDKLICGGDYSIDMLNMQNNSIQQLISTTDTFNLQQIIDRPTRITRISAILVDLIFIPNLENTFTLFYKNVPF